MTELNETTILQEGLVKITNLRTVVGTKTYPISDITSVNITKQEKSKRPFLVVIGGILLVIWAMLDQTAQFAELFNIGIAIIVASITFFILAKPTYTVQIWSASGESNILRSTDQSYVQRIVGAMNQAIASKG